MLSPTAESASANTAGDDVGAVADGDRPEAAEATAAQPVPEGGATGTPADAGQPADGGHRVVVGRDRRAAS